MGDSQPAPPTNGQASKAARHPFLSLQPDEVQFTKDALHSKHSGKPILFRSIGIKEPARAQTVEFLQGKGPAPPRRTYVSYQIKGEPTVFEDILELSTGDIFKSSNLGVTCFPPGYKRRHASSRGNCYERSACQG